MLPDKLNAAVVAHKMFDTGDVVVVGVSGGPDSVALLHSLTILREALPVRLHVAHLNHMLRGQESTEDANWVADFARRLGWPATVRAIDVFAEQRRLKASLEQVARATRYAFFAEVVRDTGAVGVAVGHTADDQIETVLMHFVRGSGLLGLRGMRPVTALRLGDRHGTGSESVRVLRPMLDVTRAEVSAHCREHALHPREDVTNRDPRFTRNRLRLSVLPRLRSLNPRFGEAVLRETRVISADDDLLDCLTSSAWQAIATERPGGIVFDLAQWQNISRSLQYRLLREAVSRLRGDILDISLTHLDSAIEVINTKSAGTSVHWPRDLRLVKRYTDFEIYCHRQSASPLSSRGEALTVPGITRVGGGRWEVTAKIGHAGCWPLGASPWQAVLDVEATGTALMVRKRCNGDRFQPMGMKNDKKLQDFLVDAKVPRLERDAVPLVVSGSRIAWVAGMRPADWAKSAPRTTRTLFLQFAPLAE